MVSFIMQFLKNPRTIGAVAPSSSCLARKMMEPIDFSRASCIVEYGPGLGAFTRELVKRKKKDTALILIEQNPQFCRRLEEIYGGDKNVSIIQGGAEHGRTYLTKLGYSQADYIVSGLPFTSLPGEITAEIFANTQKILGKGGTFITFQYSLLKKGLFQKYFRLIGCGLAFWNLPPAYVLVMKVDKKRKGRETGGGLYPDCG